jgi:anaerobic dimethyl sulfoxide reductase subunit B (iron-sulfur subunit)
VACKDWHDIPAGPENWMRMLYSEKGRYPDVFVSYLAIPCYHCLDKAPQFGPETSAKMHKCDFCLDRWEEGKKPVCAEACPTRALDAGVLSELEAKYGQNHSTEGFTYSKRTKPAIVFRPKLCKASKQ